MKKSLGFQALLLRVIKFKTPKNPVPFKWTGFCFLLDIEKVCFLKIL